MSIKIAIVEDDVELKNHFESVIGSADDFLLMKSYLNAEDFISDFISIQPIDVVLMDINLPGKSGIQCIAELKLKNPSVQFLVCTIFEDSENLFNALCAGATGYILKNTNENELLNSIRLIHAGGSPMSPQIARRVVTSFPVKKTDTDLLEQLTKREREILDLLSAGYRYKEISDKLFLGVDTVRTYIRNIYSKLQVHSRTDAVNKLFPR